MLFYVETVFPYLHHRMIRRAPGLKLVVQTLLYSLKPIGNTVLIAAIFFVMFGILGVQVKKKLPFCISIKCSFNVIYQYV